MTDLDLGSGGAAATGAQVAVQVAALPSKAGVGASTVALNMSAAKA